jgi:hypothetical protein
MAACDDGDDDDGIQAAHLNTWIASENVLQFIYASLACPLIVKMSPSTTLITALLSFGILASTAQAVTHQVNHVTLPRLATENTASIPPAPFTVPFTGSQKKRDTKKQLLKVLKKKGGRAGSGLNAPLAGSDLDEEYLVNATIGGQTFSLIVDTGSSDTWLAAQNFTCIDLASKEQPESECAFGTTFDVKASKTYKPIKNANFNITYGMFSSQLWILSLSLTTDP